MKTDQQSPSDLATKPLPQPASHRIWSLKALSRNPRSFLLLMVVGVLAATAVLTTGMLAFGPAVALPIGSVGSPGIVGATGTETAADAAEDAELLLVELFTSQGCYSCPPADEFLRELAQDPNIIPLTFHVDYWNHLGWTDPFSSAAWSDRQRRYAQILRSDTVYTPQLVIGGVVDEVGSDRRGVRRKVDEVRRQGEQRSGQAAGVSLVAELAEGPQQHIVAEASASLAKDSVLLLALYERNLSTEIPSGENRNKTLYYDWVVRTLVEAAPGESVRFDLQPKWKRQDLGVVAFVQDRTGGQVYSVARSAAPLKATTQ